MTALSLTKNRIKVLLLEGVHDSALESFHAAGYETVVRRAEALQGEALIEALDGVHLLGIRSRTQVTAEVLQAANRLIAVGCFCIGTNQVDTRAAEKAGVAVFNAPFSNTRSVAELVLAEAILLLRGVPEKNAKAHRGQWSKSASNSFEIRGKTLGVVGYGNIGAQLGVLAEGLGMRVVFHDAVKKLNLGNAEQRTTLKQLLGESDVVTLHVPANASTHNLIDADALASMKPTAVLINASRGTVVDLDALSAAISAGQLLGAAIDVYPSEPRSNDEPFDSPLRAHDNVILTPHIGGSTLEAQANIGTEVAEKLVRYSDNGSTLSAVNFPEVSLPTHAGSHRLLHIHHNVPGVLSRINQVFSEQGINVAAQYLQTTSEVGYVVMDLDSTHSDAAITALRAVEGTIRARILF